MDNPSGIYPDDIYGPNAVHYYGSNDGKMSEKAVAVVQMAQANPDAEISVYRALPTNVKDAGINEGDWVTITEDYAREHGDGPLKGDYRIVESKAKASELYTDGNSIHEWGFWPSAKTGSEDVPLSQSNNLATAMDRVTSRIMPNPKLKLATLYQDKLGLSISALQAVLWYYEQALYDAHGSSKESWNFADAAKRVADEDRSELKFPKITEDEEPGVAALAGKGR